MGRFGLLLAEEIIDFAAGLGPLGFHPDVRLEQAKHVVEII